MLVLSNLTPAAADVEWRLFPLDSSEPEANMSDRDPVAVVVISPTVATLAGSTDALFHVHVNCPTAGRRRVVACAVAVGQQGQPDVCVASVALTVNCVAIQVCVWHFLFLH